MIRVFYWLIIKLGNSVFYWSFTLRNFWTNKNHIIAFLYSWQNLYTQPQQMVVWWLNHMTYPWRHSSRPSHLNIWLSLLLKCCMSNDRLDHHLHKVWVHVFDPRSQHELNVLTLFTLLFVLGVYRLSFTSLRSQIERPISIESSSLICSIRVVPTLWCGIDNIHIILWCNSDLDLR